jgi:hypothetical protein
MELRASTETRLELDTLMGCGMKVKKVSSMKSHCTSLKCFHHSTLVLRCHVLQDAGARIKDVGHAVMAAG